MENDIAEAIETVASTNNEGNEEGSIPVELVDKEEKFHAGCGDGEPVIIQFQMKYKYNKNWLPTRKKDVVEAIDIAVLTNNVQNKDLYVAVELDDTGGGGDGDSILNEVQIQQKLTSDQGKVYYQGNRYHHINKQWRK